MSYLVLARKYRPQTFADLVGQEQVSRTLKNALATGRVAHAYLFSGPRGVGKTTAARLLAMSLSCLAENVADRPCGVCDNCLEIQSGQAVDVIEVDGASNRGINEIRDLRETVKYQPAKGRYKVYIIDEVHALTKDAFGALLKTLEEPPAHVVFIFATTETHKVLPTILSRCQRYDFRRIRVEDIADRLAKVAEMENIQAEPEALELIARQAEGGLRDSLSLMDQAIAAGGGQLTAEDVRRSLGLIDQTLVRSIVTGTLDGQAAQALKSLDEAYLRGYDFKDLGVKILEFIRGLTLVKVDSRNSALMNVTETEEKDFSDLAAQHSLETLNRHFDAWLKFQRDLNYSPQPRWQLEAQVVRLSQLAPMVPMAELIERMGKLLAQNPPPRPVLAPAPALAAPPTSAPMKAPAAPPQAPPNVESSPQMVESTSTGAENHFPANWSSFQTQYFQELDPTVQALLGKAKAQVWSSQAVVLELPAGPPMADFLIKKIEANFLDLIKTTFGLTPSLTLERPVDQVQNQDYLVEKLEAIKNTSEVKELMAKLPGDFVMFRPGTNLILEEDEAPDEAETAPLEDNDDI